MSDKLVLTPEQKAAYKANYCAKATDDQAALFFVECERRGLIPGTHVVFHLETASEYDAQLQREIPVKKVVLITTINALRLIAERSGKFRGYGAFKYYYGDPVDGQDGKIIPLGKQPHAVSVELYRENWQHPVLAVARWAACVQKKSDGAVTAMWMQRGEEQLAKCAEAAGLRMIAPEECGGLYIPEEFGGSEKQPVSERTGETITIGPALPTATVAPAVNQAPAKIEPITETVKQDRDGYTVTEKPANLAEPVAPKPTAARPAPPKPPAPKPVVAQPTPVPAPVVPNRQPHVDAPAHESIKEINEVADRIARDKDPAAVTDNIHGVNITDEDLPENMRPAATETVLVPANNPAGFVQAEQPVQTVANPSPVQGVSNPSPVEVSTGEVPADSASYGKFMERSAKIVRDKLEKDAKVKGAGALVKDYLLKQSGAAKLNKISTASFERIISALEKATPEEAAAMVKG